MISHNFSIFWGFLVEFAPYISVSWRWSHSGSFSTWRTSLDRTKVQEFQMTHVSVISKYRVNRGGVWKLRIWQREMTGRCDIFLSRCQLVGLLNLLVIFSANLEHILLLTRLLPRIVNHQHEPLVSHWLKEAGISDWCIHRFSKHSKRDKLSAVCKSKQVNRKFVTTRVSCSGINPTSSVRKFSSFQSSVQCVAWCRLCDRSFLMSPHFFLFSFQTYFNDHFFLVCHQCNNRELLTVTSVGTDQTKGKTTDLIISNGPIDPFGDQ